MQLCRGLEYGYKFLDNKHLAIANHGGTKIKKCFEPS